MSSFLSRLRREPSPGDESSPGPTPADAPPPVASRAATARSPTTNNASTPDQALVLMLAELEGYTDGLPEPSVSALRVDERALALGNRRGLERRGSFAVVELKGGRLDAVVRFQFLADEPSAVDSAVQDLQRSLLRARDALWTAGFLRVTAEGTSPAEHVPALNRWRKTTDYKVLYEYHYWDTDGAESIIARIPIHSDLEELDSLPRETTTVTDEIVRWDKEGAPALQVAALAGSRLRVAGLAVLFYLPAGWTGTEEVTLARLDRTSTGTPTLYPTLAEFLAAITDPENPDRHAQVRFASIVDFLNAFEPAGEPIELGDWDEDHMPDVYHPGTLALDPPVWLASRNDLFQVSYQDAVLGPGAVVYLRAQVNKL